MSFLVEETRDNRVQIIRCPKRIDITISSDLRDILSNLIEQGKYEIVIDLTQTQYVDSSGLGAIVSRIAAARSNKGDVRIAGPRKNVKELFQLTHLNQILKMYDNVEAASLSYER